MTELTDLERSLIKIILGAPTIKAAAANARRLLDLDLEARVRALPPIWAPPLLTIAEHLAGRRR